MHILLIDDDTELTAMLGEYLAGEGFRFTAVHTIADGIEAALSGDFDAVILDVMFPGGNGIDALRAIRAKSEVPVLMLTAKNSDMERVLGLELGADDYIAKPYFPPELVARIRAVMRRPARGTNGRDIVMLSDLRLDAGLRRVDWRGHAIDLTVTEFNLLEALLRSPDQVLDKDELSLRLLGRRREPYDRSIDVHVSNLRQKVEKACGAEIIVTTIRGIGWIVETGR